AVEPTLLQHERDVSDRYYCGRDDGRRFADLRLDDRQGLEGAAAERVVELRGALEQPRVQVEDVARVRLAARRAAQQERELAIRGGVLAEVVVDAERVALAVAEVLAHRHAAIRRDVLQRRRFRGGRDDAGGER